MEAVGALDGKRVAFIWNFLFKGPTMWGYLSDELAKRYPGVEFVDYGEFGNIHGDEEVELVAALPEKLKRLEVDAAVVGVGACGSCTPAVMRAVAKVAEAGLPSVAIVANQFQRQARMIARAQGLDSCTIAVYPGTILVDDDETFASNTMQHVFPFVLDGLTGLGTETSSSTGAADATAAKRHGRRRHRGGGARGVRGGSGRVGRGRVGASRRRDRLSRHAPGRAGRVHRSSVVRRVADHSADPATGRGVRRRIRPRRLGRSWSHAAVESRSDHLEHRHQRRDGRLPGRIHAAARRARRGSTPPVLPRTGRRRHPGWEPLVIVSGPVVEQLGFNTGAGALRIGNQANSSIGRFTRLYLRNIPGLLPGATDQGSFGFNFNIALAENGAALSEIGWPTVAEDEGFAAGTSTVTIQSVVTISSSLPSSGSTAEENLYYIAPALNQAIAVGGVFAQYNHSILYTVLAMCPPIARTIAKDGWSKDDVRRYLGDHMTTNGGLVNERAFGGSGGHKFAIERTPFGIDFLRRQGLDPATVDVSQVDFPTLVSVEKMAITAVGNPGRNHSRAFIGNHVQGARVTKAINQP